MLPDPWPAPFAERPVEAVGDLPGSKSVTNRALVLAALATGPSAVRRPLHSRDTDLMVAGLRALGVPIELDGPDGRDWLVTGVPGMLHPAAARVDAGNAGTVARFLPPVAALADAPVTFDGDPRMRERPVGQLLRALRALGVEVDGEAFPVTVRGRGAVAGGEATVDASRSSQLVSGLLLTAPRFADGLVLRHDGPPMPSQPHVAMTVAMLRSFGASVVASDGRWEVAPGGYPARDVDVEPDLSSAAPFAAAALATGGRVRFPAWPAETTQPGADLPELLERMGGSCTIGPDGLTVRGGGPVTGLDADLSSCPELAPVLAALGALASGPTRLTGIAHLRVQETDRLAALRTELGRLGAVVTELPDGLVVEPKPLRGNVFRTYDDHRIAHAAAVLGLVVPGVLIENAGTTSKTMPDFPARWAALLG